jgi:hypothetical protein
VSSYVQMITAIVMLVLLTMGTVSAIDHAVGTYGGAAAMERAP